MKSQSHLPKYFVNQNIERAGLTGDTQLQIEKGLQAIPEEERKNEKLK